MNKSKDLLEEIASHTNCDYLSDLHLTSYFREVAEAINKIKIENHTLIEWNNVARYITQQKVEFMSVEEVLQFLNKYLIDRCRIDF